MSDPREVVRAADTIGRGGNEEHRQAIGRSALDHALGLGGRLAELVDCPGCWRLMGNDEESCGDCGYEEGIS